MSALPEDVVAALVALAARRERAPELDAWRKGRREALRRWPHDPRRSGLGAGAGW